MTLIYFSFAKPSTAIDKLKLSEAAGSKRRHSVGDAHIIKKGKENSGRQSLSSANDSLNMSANLDDSISSQRQKESRSERHKRVYIYIIIIFCCFCLLMYVSVKVDLLMSIIWFLSGYCVKARTFCFKQTLKIHIILTDISLNSDNWYSYIPLRATFA